MTDEAGDIFAFLCGTCSHWMKTSNAPDFCGECHARFDKGAPYAVMRMTVVVEGLDIRTQITPEPRGPWSPSKLRALLEI